MVRASSSWRHAVARADFVPFAPVGDRIEAVWGGGFGGAPGSTEHLQIHALIDGSEMTVDTIGAARHPDPDLQRSMLVHRLIASHTLARRAIDLPFSLTVVSDDRPLTVSGRTVTFRGARVDQTTRWIGEAAVDDLLIRVELPASISVELEPCTDPAALPIEPPGPT